jgi:5,10-methylenetetrahydromethanopterin reductase
VRISLVSSLSNYPQDGLIESFVDDVRAARDEGFTTMWMAQLPWEPDDLVAMAVALREVEGITLGTSVIPIQSRLPMVLAQQALTLSLISGGRFTLGVGLTHAAISQGMWGIPWDRPVRRLNEYLDGLLPLLAGERVKAVGETISTRGAISIPAAVTPPVYVAALGPQMLCVAGRRAKGTITQMTGPKTLASHVVPTIQDAAAAVGRRADVVAILPTCVTDDVGVRDSLADVLAQYSALPSYRAMLEREGIIDPIDVAVVGDEDCVVEQLDAIRRSGVDEFGALVFSPNDETRARTRALLRRYAS